MSTGHWIGAARYGLPGLAVGLVLAWWSGGHGPMATAKAAPPVAETNGTMAFTSNMIAPVNGGNPSQLLYILDTKTQSFAVYRVEAGGSKESGSVKLEAARQYRWDLQLSEYNNLSPEASAVEDMIKKSKAK